SGDRGRAQSRAGQRAVLRLARRRIAPILGDGAGTRCGSAPVSVARCPRRSQAMSTPGRLITLEGGEGAGKSTHARFVAAWLEGRGREVVQTREPGGSPLAEAIRELVLRDWAEGVSAETELLLMFAARAAHVTHRIEPALHAGRDVVC